MTQCRGRIKTMSVLYVREPIGARQSTAAGTRPAVHIVTVDRRNVCIDTEEYNNIVRSSSLVLSSSSSSSSDGAGARI